MWNKRILWLGNASFKLTTRAALKKNNNFKKKQTNISLKVQKLKTVSYSKKRNFTDANLHKSQNIVTIFNMTVCVSLSLSLSSTLVFSLLEMHSFILHLTICFVLELYFLLLYSKTFPIKILSVWVSERKSERGNPPQNAHRRPNIANLINHSFCHRLHRIKPLNAERMDEISGLILNS